MNRLRVILFTVTLIFLLPIIPSIASAQEASTGVIKGRVINKTLNEEGVGVLEVSLSRFAEEKWEEASRTKTDNEGFFSFQDLNNDKKIAYHVSTAYGEVGYFSEPFHFQDNGVPPIDLLVYETTDQEKDVSIRMHHILFELEKGLFSVREFLIIENRGDKTFLGSRESQSSLRQTLRISLPSGVTNLQFSDPSIVRSGEGLSYTGEIKPGRKQMVFSYALGTDGSNKIFRKEVTLKTESVEFIYPEKGVKVRSDQLEAMGTVEGPGQRFLHLSGKNFSKGSLILVELRLSGAKSGFKWVISGLVILLFGAGFVFSFIRRKKKSAGEEEASKLPREDRALSEERHSVLKTIAKLDDRLDAGEIDPDLYHKERSELLNKAKKLSRTLDRGTDRESAENGSAAGRE